MQVIPACKPMMYSFPEEKDLKAIYKRRASLYCCAVERVDDELVLPELMRRGVKLLDSYFRSACEMDFGFNLEKACFLRDEISMGG